MLHLLYLLYRGLIPAWAGKTATPESSVTSSVAHPRVGGENQPDTTITGGGVGSSPRGRGKHVLVLLVLL